MISFGLLEDDTMSKMLCMLAVALVILTLLTGCATNSHHPDTPRKYDPVQGWNHGL